MLTVPSSPACYIDSELGDHISPTKGHPQDERYKSALNLDPGSRLQGEVLRAGTHEFHSHRSLQVTALLVSLQAAPEVWFPPSMWGLIFPALSFLLLAVVAERSHDKAKQRSQIEATLSFPFSLCGSYIFGITSV